MPGRLSRRRFLQGVAALGAATRLPGDLIEAALAAGDTGTTLDRTVVRLSGAGYVTLGLGPGESHLAHPDNPVRRRAGVRRRVLVAFAHLTDVHVIDAQSPARVEFLDRFAEGPCAPLPFAASFRPHETLTTQVHSAMVRAVNRVQARRVAAGRTPLAFAVATGDNCDNQQANELAWFLAAMDGSPALVPDSGGRAYEGVQAPAWGDPSYWLPRADLPDAYKARGFPGEDAWRFGRDGLLAAATTGFAAPALALPWYVAYGNHDGLLQGNAPAGPLLDPIAVGGLKVTGPPPGLDPCRAFAAAQADPRRLLSGPARRVTPDPGRRVLSRRRFVAAHLGHRGHPGFGHGFTAAHARSGEAYYVVDAVPGFRFVTLDTVNPAGYQDGSIGERQFRWLAHHLATAGDRYVVLFSHHGLHSLTNPVVVPDPQSGRLERRVLADEVEALLHRFPAVVAWIAGHTHRNRITRRRGADGHVFWDVETAAHVDWPGQSRIVEVLDDGDVLTLRLTLVDHAGPVRRQDLGGGDLTLRLAGISRELSANDPQRNPEAGGGRYDRNVELTVPKPVLRPVAAAPPAAPIPNSVAVTAPPSAITATERLGLPGIGLHLPR